MCLGVDKESPLRASLTTTLSGWSETRHGQMERPDYLSKTTYVHPGGHTRWCCTSYRCIINVEPCAKVCQFHQALSPSPAPKLRSGARITAHCCDLVPRLIIQGFDYGLCCGFIWPRVPNKIRILLAEYPLMSTTHFRGALPTPYRTNDTRIASLFSRATSSDILQKVLHSPPENETEQNRKY